MQDKYPLKTMAIAVAFANPIMATTDISPEKKVSNGYALAELITKINAANTNDEVVALSYELRTFVNKLINNKKEAI